MGGGSRFPTSTKQSCSVSKWFVLALVVWWRLAHPCFTQQRNGELTPRRQKTFSTHLSDALPTSLGTGSSSLLFTRDSRRLILATSFGSSIAVVELPTGKDEDFEVVKVFGEHGARDGGRELRGKVVNGKAVNGETNGDVTMNGTHESDSEEDEDDSDDESFAGASASMQNRPATVTCLAVSSDGKWLSSADLERKVCVFDLEELKVSCCLLLALPVRVLTPPSFLAALHHPSYARSRPQRALLPPYLHYH